jgi:molybdate transport system permease protein
VLWSPLILSFEIATLATVIAATVGIAIATALSNLRFPGRELVDGAVAAPILLPPTVLGYYLLIAVGRRSSIGHVYEALFGTSIVFTRTGAVLAATVGALPLVARGSRAALEAVDPSLIGAARTLGAGLVRAFFSVQLPLAARGIAAAVMLAFARSLGDFGATLMVAGDIPGETRTASLAIYDAIQERRDGAALGMVAMLTMVAIAVQWAVGRMSARRAE